MRSVPAVAWTASLVPRAFRPDDRPGIRELWRECGLVHAPNNPDEDIDHKLRQDPEGLLVLEMEGKLLGTVMVGYEGHRGWVNYLAVLPSMRRRGLGRILMSAAESRLRALGCPKVNLQVRRSNDSVLAFYRSLGYGVDDVVSLGKRLPEV